jgi:HAD superfamily hydrolase (TIGR01509 family)
MTQPKAVIFDLGKVLLDFDYRIAGRKLAARSNLAAETFTNSLLQPDLLHQYETGLLNNEEFFHALCRKTGYCGDFNDFARSFGDIFTPIDPMIALHRELREKGYPTFIFSNTNELAVDHIRRAYPFFANFDGYVLSFEHRCMKPDARLYAIAEEMSGRYGQELLYLDDRLENIQAAAVRGWQIILHETPEKTLARMQTLGMLNQD